MYKSYISLKLSSILLLSQLIGSSFQFEQCLVTLKNVRVERDYSFSLAQVVNLEDPLGPQEACYYSCGGQILTQSADDGDMTKLTLLDKSANFLTSTGFLRIDHVYFVNHLGFPDEKGGNGIGCVQIKNTKQFDHYPLTHSVCKEARNAICGFWGNQIIPYGPLNRNGSTILEPNASTISIEEKPIKLPDLTPKPQARPEPEHNPEPKPEPENHNSWNSGNIGGWEGEGRGNQHRWDEVEEQLNQFNLEATISQAGPEFPLLDSTITLPVVRYERDPVNGELIEVTKYATFVQLSDHELTQNSEDYQTKYADGIPSPAQQTGLVQVKEINHGDIELADEDYEFRLPPVEILSDVSYINPKGTIMNNNNLKEEDKMEEQELEEEEALDEVPINIDNNPSHVAPFSEQEQQQLEIPMIELVSIVHEEVKTTTGEDEIINFDALDDLGDITGENIIAKILNVDIDNTLLEQQSTMVISNVANTTVQDAIEQIPVMVMDLNDTASKNVEFNVMGKIYKVIPHLNHGDKTMEQAKSLCMENDSLMSKVDSTDYSELTTKLKLAGLDNIAIGSWNGNDYLLTGPNCLLVQVGLGVFPGECASASAVMCQI